MNPPSFAKYRAVCVSVIVVHLIAFLSQITTLNAAYDPLTPAQVAQLKSELATDPQALGYAAAFAAGDHGTPASLINLVRAGAAYQVDRELIPAHMLFASVDATEFAALTTLQLTQLSAILASGQIDLSKANIRTMLSAIFPSGGPTRTALIALAKRQGSRAEVLFGPGTTLSNQHISQAWRS